MVLVFYRRPFFLTFEIALLDVSVYFRSRKYHYGFTAPVEEVLFRTEPVEVELAGGSLKQDEAGYRVQIAERELELDLTFQPLVESYQPQEITLFEGEDTRFSWKVYAPAAQISGTIRLDGQEITLRGEGYLDYNRCNRPFNRFIRQWHWGRFHSPEKTIVVGSVLYRNGRRVSPLLTVTEEGARLEMLSGEMRFGEKIIQMPPEAPWPHLALGNRQPLDRVRFLISPIPPRWRFPRKVHEFLFYRLDEWRGGKILTKYLANVDYRRELVAVHENSKKKYHGIIEEMRFD